MPAAAVVRAPEVGLVRIRLRVEVEERRSLTGREAGQLDERRVGPEPRIGRPARTARVIPNASAAVVPGARRPVMPVWPLSSVVARSKYERRVPYSVWCGYRTSRPRGSARTLSLPLIELRRAARLA